jgi:hypothetical protein
LSAAAQQPRILETRYRLTNCKLAHLSPRKCLDLAGRSSVPVCFLEHDPEKWKPVFG